MTSSPSCGGDSGPDWKPESGSVIMRQRNRGAFIVGANPQSVTEWCVLPHGIR